MSGYIPYSCMSCVQFTEEENSFSHTNCELPGTLIQSQDVEIDVLRRYMEVYDRPLYWTGYEFANGEAVVPRSNLSINVTFFNTQNCNASVCCVAWQLDPFGLTTLECDKQLPAICTTTVNCELIVNS